MRFIRETVYERIKREVEDSLKFGESPIVRVEVSPSEWEQLQEMVQVNGKTMLLPFYKPTSSQNLFSNNCVHTAEVHTVTVVRIDEEVEGF